MANDVKWIKMMVGMFDGMSFKKIKRAKIGGESFRDKLTAVWFELMDFAGRCNHDGAFISPAEIPFTELSDIATMIDRDEEELRLCMAFFIQEGMVTVIDDVYSLSNWTAYQNKEGLDAIREKNRLRQAKFKQKQRLLASGENSNVTGNVTVTLGNALEGDKDGEGEKDLSKERGGEIPPAPTPQEIVNLYNEICKSFPAVRTVSEARKKAIRARLNTYQPEDFKALFEAAEASSFLKGKNPRNWSANFDWLIKDANMAKVLEGQYKDKGASSGESSFDVNDFFNASAGRAYGRAALEREVAAKMGTGTEGKRTIDNDEELRRRADELRQKLS